MFYICETEEQLEFLESLGEKGGYVEVVTTNDNFHPILTGLVAVYIRPFHREEIVDPCTGVVSLDTTHGYIIPVCHDEGLNVSKERVEQVLEKYSKIHVLNKKDFLYHFNLKTSIIDDSLKYSMIVFDKLCTSVTESTYNWFYNRYGGLDNINQIIPLSKIYEKCEDTFKQLESLEFISEEGTRNNIFTVQNPPGFNFYNELATKAFFLVEQSGLRVDVHDFVERYRPTNPEFSIIGETVYTKYNLYNATSRPTNSFNAVNFLALPKGQEFRRCFKPTYPGGQLVEMDFDGYHIRLVSDRIGYKLNTEEKAHKQLAKLWFGKDEISDEEYSKAKVTNFQVIYGTIPPEYTFFEFTEKLQEYINSMWKSWEIQGYVKNPDSNKSFNTNLTGMYPQKLMNYMVQSLETSRNVLILCKVLGFLARGGFKSKVCLITYDSFLIDWCPDDGEIVLDGIRKIMEGQPEHDMNGTAVFPVSVKRSKDLNF